MSIPEPVEGQPMIARVKVTNLGQTLAKNFVKSIFTVFTDNESINPFLSPDVRFKMKPGSKPGHLFHVLFPGGSDVASLGAPESEMPLVDPAGSGDYWHWDAQEISKLNEGKRRLYIFGTFWYVDIYDHPHYTQYCFVYTGGKQAHCSVPEGIDDDRQ